MAGTTEESNFQSFFEEAKEVHGLLDQLSEPDNAENVDKVCEILDKYQEQPELLDPELENMVSTLMAAVRKDLNNSTVIHRCFKVVYGLCKVRGYKTVVRFFPHEVSGLEPALKLLPSQNPTDFVVTRGRPPQSNRLQWQ